MVAFKQSNLKIFYNADDTFSCKNIYKVIAMLIIVLEDIKIIIPYLVSFIWALYGNIFTKYGHNYKYCLNLTGESIPICQGQTDSKAVCK